MTSRMKCYRIYSNLTEEPIEFFCSCRSDALNIANAIYLQDEVEYVDLLVRDSNFDYVMLWQLVKI